jgi:hypothetical protein
VYKLLQVVEDLLSQVWSFESIDFQMVPLFEKGRAWAGTANILKAHSVCGDECDFDIVPPNKGLV